MMQSEQALFIWPISMLLKFAKLIKIQFFASVDKVFLLNFDFSMVPIFMKFFFVNSFEQSQFQMPAQSKSQLRLEDTLTSNLKLLLKLKFVA